LEPGDGYQGEPGPLVLEPPHGDRSVRMVAPSRARELCGERWSWIERVRQ
jgi:hypothetical protein